MDITSLLGPRTGIGAMVDALTARLPALLNGPDGGDLGNGDNGEVSGSVELTGYIASVRGRRDLRSVAPAGWEISALPYPARVAHRLWRSIDVPAVGRFDLIHGPNYVVPPAGAGARLVTVHDLTAWRYPELVNDYCRHYPEHLRRAVATGAHVHAVSHFVAGELTGDLNVPAERVHVVENGYHRRGTDGDADRGRAAAGGPYVLTVGTVEPRKDHVGLVKAMAEVWTRFPEVRLVIVGQDGWGADQLDRTVARLGCADRVIRPGYVDAGLKQDLLAGAELLAFPSRYEGFGIPILEAMDAGVPVVSTTAGAIPEVAGGAAVLVEPGQPEAMAHAIGTVLSDEGHRAALVNAGRTNANRYSWDRAAATMAALYRTLVADRYRRGDPPRPTGLTPSRPTGPGLRSQTD